MLIGLLEFVKTLFGRGISKKGLPIKTRVTQLFREKSAWNIAGAAMELREDTVAVSTAFTGLIKEGIIRPRPVAEGQDPEAAYAIYELVPRA